MDAVMGLTLFQSAGNDPEGSVKTRGGVIESVKSELRFLVFRVGTMTFEAFVRKNGPNISIELQGFGKRT